VQHTVGPQTPNAPHTTGAARRIRSGGAAKGGGGAGKGGGGAGKGGGRPLVCDQRAGEVIVLPELWGHATTNLAWSVGWASEFHFDRAMDDGLSPTHGDEWWRTAERASERESARAQREPAKRRTDAPARAAHGTAAPLGVYGRHDEL
jgi:hypothetical protein